MSRQGSHTSASPLVRWDVDGVVSLEDRTFLNERIATFGALIGIISFGFLVIDAITGLSLESPSVVLAVLLSRDTAMHMAAVAVSALQWLLCRGRARSLPQLATIDALGIGLAMTLYALMVMIGRDGSLAFHDGLALSLIALAVVVARAVIVPASMGRTAIISAVACLPVVLVCFNAIGRPGPVETRMNIAGAVYIATWAAVAVTLASASARIIYGLREQVRAATQLGQYTLEEKIGEGGMGTVYRARHALLRRPTAVKLLPGDRAGSVQIQRFEKEVQLTSALTHPNTISIYDYGHAEDGTFYYAMEYLDGITLEDLVAAEGALPPPRVAHIVAQVAGALSEAHEVGLIHRDVKPANIMLCGRGGVFDHVKVLDFGLVKELDGGASPALSGTNALVGTPLYLSPEAIVAAASVDARSDLYGLGAVGYFLLTGTPPFDGDSLVQICARHLHEAPEPPSKRLGARVPAALEELIIACLAKTPDDRPGSARELRRRIVECGLPSWSEEDAQRWWQDRAEAVQTRSRARAGASHVRGMATVAVDLVRRAHTEGLATKRA